MRICVVTSYPAHVEPRGPRHAVAARMAYPDAAVTFVEHCPLGASERPVTPLLEGQEIELVSRRFPTRRHGMGRLAMRKLRTWFSRRRFARSGKLDERIFGAQFFGLTELLCRTRYDAIIAHNIETLLPAATAARKHGAALIFDCMEFYSDMGDGQLSIESAAAAQIEGELLPQCSLVLASSDALAEELARKYDISPPLGSYNVPKIVPELPERRKDGGLNLYWRNSVVDFGQRGLDDAFQALVELPDDVRLFLQGRPPGHDGIAQRAGELGIADRVTLLPPYRSDQAVQQAAAFDIGLCLERTGPRNHELTVSNKMFDYHMAGLAVVTSDMPSLASVIERSGGGETYRAGDPADLARVLQTFYDAPDKLRHMQQKARDFALDKANMDVELPRLANAFAAAIGNGAK